jgi:dihydroorotate dehydrogenase (fumarate)
MDLATNYLGLKLAHPLMPGACPALTEINMARKLEAAGASAIVMHSLFEEQIAQEELGSVFYSGMYTNMSAEVRALYPKPHEFAHDPKHYMAHVSALKKALKIPVIASLNCTSPGRWTEHARMIQYAGADALELNVYYLSTDPEDTGQMVEKRLLTIVEHVRAATSLPIAVKLSPFFSSLPNIARRMEQLGVNGLVLFNRFYEPDIDVQQKQTVPRLHLSPASDTEELVMRLHWLSIISSRSHLSLAITGGVHAGVDVLKAVLAGADAVQLVSSLLSGGPEQLTMLLTGLKTWLERIKCETLADVRGAMNLTTSADPAAEERAGYLSVLQEWSRQHDTAPAQTY